MSLFKKKLSLEDILEGISNLTDEEKGKVKAMFEESQEEPESEEVENVEEESTDNAPVEEKVEEVDEGTETPTEEVAKGEVQEETIETPTEEQPPVVEEPIVEETEVIEENTETPVEEVSPEVQKQEEELDDAQTAKIQALEEKCAMLEEKLEQVLSSLENKDFGLNPGVPEGGGEDHNRMNAVMRGYAGGNANRYL